MWVTLPNSKRSEENNLKIVEVIVLGLCSSWPLKVQRCLAEGFKIFSCILPGPEV